MSNLEALRHQIADATVECPGDNVVPPPSYGVIHALAHCTRCDDTGRVAKYPWARQGCPCLGMFDGINHYYDTTDGAHCCRLFIYEAGIESNDCDLCHGKRYVPHPNLEWLCLQELWSEGVKLLEYSNTPFYRVFETPWWDEIGSGATTEEAILRAVIKKGTV